MLKEPQTHRSVLFYENDQDIKCKIEYANADLETVARTIRDFLRCSGYDYIDNVALMSNDGQATYADESLEMERHIAADNEDGGPF